MLALKTHLRLRVRPPKTGRTKSNRTVAVCALVLFAAVVAGLPNLQSLSTSTPSSELTRERARLSERVSVSVTNSADHTVSLQAGRELISRYRGDGKITSALAENLAEPRSLAAADFDEDGVPGSGEWLRLCKPGNCHCSSRQC